MQRGSVLWCCVHSSPNRQAPIWAGLFGQLPTGSAFRGRVALSGCADHRLWSELLEGAGGRCVPRAISVEGLRVIFSDEATMQRVQFRPYLIYSSSNRQAPIWGASGERPAARAAISLIGASFPDQNAWHQTTYLPQTRIANAANSPEQTQIKAPIEAVEQVLAIDACGIQKCHKPPRRLTDKGGHLQGPSRLGQEFDVAEISATQIVSWIGPCGLGATHRPLDVGQERFGV